MGLAAGQRVLIHAAAGGVGHLAVQLAKWRGAYVLATASAKNAAFVQGLGADEVIDYTAGDFRQAVLARHPGGVDAVFDTVGGETQAKSVEVIKEGGALISITTTPPEDVLAPKKIRPGYVFVSPNS